MADPIRPEDHSFDEVVREMLANNDGHLIALGEAIHQCFERDAQVIRDGTHNTGARGSDTDPDTEIDRQARLIVQGEYRRRASTEDES